MIASIKTLDFSEGLPLYPEVIAVNSCLIEIVSSGEIMERIRAWEEREAYRKANGIKIAWGNSNIGEIGGWEEVAILNSSGEVTLGTRTSRGWCENDTQVYKLVAAESTRKAVLQRRLERHEHLNEVLALRPLWAAIHREYFGDPDNVPSKEDFTPITIELMDAEGRAFLEGEEGTMLWEHPLYYELFSERAPEDIELTIEGTISQE